jgi:hypothetical protein
MNNLLFRTSAIDKFVFAEVKICNFRKSQTGGTGERGVGREWDGKGEMEGM